MRKYLFILLCGLLSVTVAKADLLDDILSGAYNAETLSLREQDSILNENLQQSEDAEPLRYELRHENEQHLFRHSYLATYYLWDTRKKVRVDLPGQPVRDAVMSPNGKYVAYAREGNIYLYKTDFRTEVPVTHDGFDIDDNFVGADIFNGVSDWLYEEEFSVTCLMSFSPDSKYLAFIRLDEKDVPTMTWQNFLTPASTEGVYPTAESLRYPKAGCPNAVASACVYDIYYKSVKTMQLPELDDAYLPRLRWRDDSMLLLQRLRRDQNRMQVFSCHPSSSVATLLYEESQKDYYVDYELFDEWQWLADNRFFVVSEQQGWRQVFLYSALGQREYALTPAGMDVTAVYGYDPRAGVLYYQAAPTPMTRQAYAYNLKKKTTTCLTRGEGTHSLRFAQDFSRYIDCYQSTTTPNRYTLYLANGKKVRELLNNDALCQRWEALRLPEYQFASFRTERGDTLHYWRLMPTDQPLRGIVLTQYSGPSSQRVLDRWRKRFEYYLASAGYMVVCTDPRGTDARGRDWRAATYMNLGEKEAEDMLSFVRYVHTWPEATGLKLAMIGWSYGGFQTLTTLSMQGAEPAGAGYPIACGVAIAPVTDWRLYDSAYTERYMRRPQVNEAGYDRSDVCRKASSLTVPLLLMHGMADDNVHVQHTFRYAEALTAAGKSFDMQIYPDDNHFLRRRANYRHVHERLLRFLENNL